MAGCSGNPAEVSDRRNDIPGRRAWTAAATPIAPATVAGAADIRSASGLSFGRDIRRQRAAERRVPVADLQAGLLGQRRRNRDQAFTGQTGLTLFATTASYPDITLDASGKATIKAQIAGWLDSLTAYSVRIRPTATTTFTGVNPASCGNLKYAPAS